MVATLTIPRQELPDNDNIKAIENLSLTPFRCLQDNCPIGTVQNSRLYVYKDSSSARHKANGSINEELSSLEKVLNNS